MFPDRMFPYITLLSSPGGMPRSSQAAFCKEENSSITAVLESKRGGSAGHGKMRKKKTTLVVMRRLTFPKEAKVSLILYHYYFHYDKNDMIW